MRLQKKQDDKRLEFILFDDTGPRTHEIDRRLESFANEMLASSVNLSQEIVDIMNDHFWEMF